MRKYFILILSVLFLMHSCGENNDANSESQSVSEEKGGSMATFILKGNYLYVVDQSRINVFSVSDAENPVKINSVEIGLNIETLFSFDKYLFVGSQNGMFIFSIEENPEVPTFVSAAQHFTACDPVVANANNAFVTLHTNTVCNTNVSLNKLMVYDIANISNPLLISERNLLEPKGLGLYNDYLLICDKNDLLVFDVSDPKNIQLKKTIANVPAIDLIIRGNHLFAFTTNSVHQYSLDPNNIENINEISIFGL